MTPNWIERAAEKIIKKYLASLYAEKEVDNDQQSKDIYNSVKQGIAGIIKTQYINRHKIRRKK